MEKKLRQSNATQEQKKILVEFIKSRPQFASGKFSNDFTQRESQFLWQEVTQILNSCPGANKDWKSWRKTLQDIRSRTKTKIGKYLAERNKTGGGPYEDDPMTGYEADVLDIIKPVSVEGHNNVYESVAEFSFDDENDMILPNNATVHDKDLHNEYIMNNIKRSITSTTTEIVSPKKVINIGITPNSIASEFLQPFQNPPQKKMHHVFTPNKATVTKEEYIINRDKNEIESPAKATSSAAASISPKKVVNFDIMPKEPSNFPKAPRKCPQKKLQQATAAENYRQSLNTKNKIKSEYYKQKIELLERLAIAKEKSAAAKERSASAAAKERSAAAKEKKVWILEKIADNLGSLSSAVDRIHEKID